MKQFYACNAAVGTYTNCNFNAPVRKITLSTVRGCYVRLPYGGGSYSESFLIPANYPTVIDFQSLNGGKGVSSIEVTAVADVATVLYMSVIEYGSDGDNDWYK